MNRKELDSLIARYFDGATTLDEERRLRSLLANPQAIGPAADEARAVMGVFAAQRMSKSAHRTRSRATAWRAAAGFAVLVAAGAILLTTSRGAENGTYTAYCGGVEITDRADVLGFMQADLDAMADAAGSVSNSVESDFDAVINAINNSK